MQRSLDLIDEGSPQALVNWSNVHAILRAAITDGVLCALLLKTDGSLLASAQSPGSLIPPKVVGGLAVSVWRSYDLVDAEDDDYLLGDEQLHDQQQQHQYRQQQVADQQEHSDWARASNSMMQSLDPLEAGDDFPSLGDAQQDLLPVGGGASSAGATAAGDAGSAAGETSIGVSLGVPSNDLDDGLVESGVTGGVATSIAAGASGAVGSVADPVAGSGAGGNGAGATGVGGAVDGFEDPDAVSGVAYAPESQLRELLVECDRGSLALLLISRFVLCLFADGGGDLTMGGLRYRLRAVAHQLRALGELYPE